jgi:hypothetical protein|tara:strand:- start:636 stop:851 length:216 start_codon:yes stop_codon:yes gene_type:complete
MDKKVKELMLAYMDWQKHQPKDHYEIETPDYKVVIDGIEVDIPTEEDLLTSFEREAAELEVTVDYYMDEFL